MAAATASSSSSGGSGSSGRRSKRQWKRRRAAGSVRQYAYACMTGGRQREAVGDARAGDTSAGPNAAVDFVSLFVRRRRVGVFHWIEHSSPVSEHISQEMKEAMKVACQTPKHSSRTASVSSTKQLKPQPTLLAILTAVPLPIALPMVPTATAFAILHTSRAKVPRPFGLVWWAQASAGLTAVSTRGPVSPADPLVRPRASRGCALRCS